MTFPPPRPAAVRVAAAILFATPHLAGGDIVILREGRRILPAKSVVRKDRQVEVATAYGRVVLDADAVLQVIGRPEDLERQAADQRMTARGRYTEGVASSDPSVRKKSLDEAAAAQEAAVRLLSDLIEAFPDSADRLFAPLDEARAELGLYRRRRDDAGGGPSQPVPGPGTSPPPPGPTPGGTTAPRTPDPEPTPAPRTSLDASARDRISREIQNPDAKTRIAALDRIGNAADDALLNALLQAMLVEKDFEAAKILSDVLGAYDGDTLARSFRPLVPKAGPDAKIIMCRAGKRTGGEKAVDFLISLYFSQEGDIRMRPMFTSALRRNAAIALPKMMNQFRRSEREPAVQLEAVKIIGLMNTLEGAKFMVQLLGAPSDPIRNAAINALIHLGKPAIPGLTQGLSGSAVQKRWSLHTLRRILRDPDAGDTAGWWQQYWAANRAGIESDRARWEKDDADRFHPVTPNDFKIYDIDHGK